MLFVGIDPGHSGGIAKINGSKVVAMRMPTITIERAGKKRKAYDHEALTIIFTALDPGYAVLEEQHPIHGQGLTSTCSICYGFGALKQCLVDSFIKHEVVRAKEWQKEFGIAGKQGDTKAQALLKVRELFPDVNLLATKRSKKPHDGMADSLLIAEFARRRFERK